MAIIGGSRCSPSISLILKKQSLLFLLIIQGGMDISVSPQKTDEMMLRLKALGKINIEYRHYESLDHGLKNSNGKSPQRGRQRYEYMVKAKQPKPINPVSTGLKR
ncbi:hypothetical protein [Aeromonas sp. Marseille-Q7275]